MLFCRKLLSVFLSASILITNITQAFVPSVGARATAPTAVLGACVGIASIAGCLPNMPVCQSGDKYGTVIADN
jgi:hypothetical protein